MIMIDDWRLAIVVGNGESNKNKTVVMDNNNNNNGGGCDGNE